MAKSFLELDTFSLLSSVYDAGLFQDSVTSETGEFHRRIMQYNLLMLHTYLRRIALHSTCV